MIERVNKVSSVENQHNKVVTNSFESEEMDYNYKWCSKNRHDIN